MTVRAITVADKARAVMRALRRAQRVRITQGQRRTIVNNIHVRLPEGTSPEDLAKYPFLAAQGVIKRRDDAPPSEDVIRRMRDGEPPTWPHYWSTYCIHELHVQCRLTCKHCEALCLCACHNAEATEADEGA